MMTKLEILLERERLTQTELEVRAGLPKNRITKWRDGQGEPTARQAARMARVLRCPVGWLADDDVEGPLPAPVTSSGGGYLSELSYAQKTILLMVEELGLDLGSAMRRLAHPVPSPPPLPGDRQRGNNNGGGAA